MKHLPERILKFPLTKTEIKNLSNKDIDSLVSLDEHGLIIGYKEDFLSYKKRLSSIESEIQSLKEKLVTKGQVKLFHKIYATKKNLIDTNILEQAARHTENAYNFSINWIPGFFLSKGLGLLTGGCSVTTETGFTFFLIRSAFSSREKWLWYSRTELLSHELCHAARGPIKDKHLEEFFAYKLSSSPFRRFFGNCFQSHSDAILLLFPLFLLLVVQILNTLLFSVIPILWFWIIAFIYPVFLLVRNQFYRNCYFKARKSLLSILSNNISKSTYFLKVNRKYQDQFKKSVSRNKNRFAYILSDSILFRCNADEVIQIGRFINSPTKLKKWVEDNVKTQVRWKIIYERFIKTQICEPGTKKLH
jgi:hypothetical protein